jgi:hypothetical protein
MRKTEFRVEQLEERAMPATFGIPWNDPNLTLSFAPDGTGITGTTNTLSQTLARTHSEQEWQREILLAFQTWIRNTNLNIGVVADLGTSFNSPGLVQGDPRFGDIRIGAAKLDRGALAVGTPPDPAIVGTAGGDIVLNSIYQFKDKFDLRTVMLHEAGHALGLDHSANSQSPLFPRYNGTKWELQSSDIEAIQALYGPRVADVYEGNTGNDLTATATSLMQVGNDRTSYLAIADLTTSNDVDVFVFETTNSTSDEDDDESVTVRLDSTGLSLLAAKMQIFYIEDGQEKEVANATANPDDSDGSSIYVNFDANDDDGPRQYFIRVHKADNTLFDVGSYAIAVTFSTADFPPPPTLDAILMNPRESLTGEQLSVLLQNPNGPLLDPEVGTNETAGQAMIMPAVPGSAGSRFEIIASIHSVLDVDFYRTTAPAGAASGVLTATIWGLSGESLQPRLQLLNSLGEVLPTDILVQDRGVLTLQARGVVPGSSYYLRVSVPSGSAGNYYISAHYSPVAASLETLASGYFTSSKPVRGDVLVLTQSQKFHFNLTASHPDISSTAGVRMVILDSNGKIVFSLHAPARETISGTTNWLKPGEYRVQFLAVNGDANLDQLRFTLRGIRLTDPVGPLISDPTVEPSLLEIYFRHAINIVRANPFYWFPYRS